jgi:adenylate cyclase
VLRLESQHVLPFPPETVWPALSNTDWLNRSLGLPPVNYSVKPLAEGGSSTTARARIFGREMRWREFPFEWLEPEFYRVHRVYETGPFREARLGTELIPQADGSTQVLMYSEVVPRSALDGWLIKRVFGPKTLRDAARIVAHLEASLRAKAAVVLPRLPVHPPNEAALQTGLAKLRATGQPESGVKTLEALLRDSPDMELSHIRPFAIARRWGLDQWATLELFLQATRCGLVDLSWELLCPNCRSMPLSPSLSLSQIQRTAHCEVCQIKYDAEFDKSVELKFAVSPAIRPRENQVYCLAGPGGKPHVLSQIWLEPGEEKLWKLPTQYAGRKLRSPQVKAPHIFADDAAQLSGQRLVIRCEASGFAISSEPDDGRSGFARVKNPNAFPALLILEQQQWSDDILTAARVTNWQSFRDLFSSEVISPTEQITVGAQVILFTDLRGSTAMYRGLGDAPAYSIVRNHFAVLLEAVRAHHGTVVKTIGDAVMAAFSRVDEALEAVRDMHANLPTVNAREKGPLALKSSLHVGPCLAVNANDRLDYFGTTVNLAARMVSCCQGGDLTISDDLFQRPEVAKFLEGRPRPEASEVRFRGFDVPNRVWRIVMVAAPK